jgi:hypothetical protein
VTSLSCKFDISALSISWHSVGSEHGRETDWWHYAADRSSVALREQQQRNVLRREVLKHLYLSLRHSVIVGPLMSVQFASESEMLEDVVQ